VTLMVRHMVHLQDVGKLHTFVFGNLGALLLACLGFDLRFALVAFDLVSDSIWCEGVGVGVGARGGSTWAVGDYLRGALGWERRANLRKTNKASSNTHAQAQATEPLHRGPPVPIPTAIQQEPAVKTGRQRRSPPSLSKWSSVTAPAAPDMACSDTHLLLGWLELDEPRALSHVEDDNADEPRRRARTVTDVLDTISRCTLRRQRIAVKVAIRLNRATVCQQQRVVAAAAPTGDLAPGPATLDEARLALRDGAGGTDAFWVMGASGDSDAATGVCPDRWSGGRRPAVCQCLSVGGTDGARGQRESCDDGLSASDAA